MSIISVNLFDVFWFANLVLIFGFLYKNTDWEIFVGFFMIFVVLSLSIR